MAVSLWTGLRRGMIDESWDGERLARLAHRAPCHLMRLKFDSGMVVPTNAVILSDHAMSKDVQNLRRRTCARTLVRLASLRR